MACGTPGLADSWFELQASMGGLEERTTRAFQQQLQQQHSWDTNTGSIPP